MKFPRKGGWVSVSGRQIATLLGLGLVVVVFAFALLNQGAYNITALKQHTQLIYNVLGYAMMRSLETRSRDIELPDLEEVNVLAGIALYEEHCMRCHGAPGIGPDSFSLGMVPAPTAIASIARKRDAKEIYWAIENGIKMTGMPAWRYRMSDEQMWQLVAFVIKVTELSVPEYTDLRERALAVYGTPEGSGHFEMDPESSPIEYGRVALQQYNCAACHQIPGVTSADNHVGPPLAGVAKRAFIAGVLANTDENLIRFIRFPQEVDPKSAMPNLGVSEFHARLMVLYLRSLEE
jgi:mono/diheme cytochrome c family protein